MIAYKYRFQDMVYEGPVYLPDGPSIPKYHTFTAPPEMTENQHAVMNGGWQIVDGPSPAVPDWWYAQEVKKLRTQKLNDSVYKINPLMWQSMDQATQAAYSTYRQELLDITTQEGYPVNVTWPVLTLP